MTPRLWDLLTRALSGERLPPHEATEARRLLGHRPPSADLFPSALPHSTAVAREEFPAPRTPEAYPLAMPVRDAP